MAKRPTKLERTAYHEAGHAVAAYSLRRKIIEVSIVPEPGLLGRVTHTLLKDFHPDYDTRLSTLRKGEKEITFSLAGIIAQKRLTGRRDWTLGHIDITDALGIASNLMGDDKEAQRYVNKLWHKTEKLIYAPPRWAAVKALAAELLRCRKMSGRKARRIMFQAIRTAHTK